MALRTPLTLGQRAADFAAARIGSWAFLILFNAFVAFWCLLQRALGLYAFDPFPYVLLNLLFSWLAGVQAPVIMISQNRQEQLLRQQIRHMITMQEAIRDHLLASNCPAHSASGEALEAVKQQLGAIQTVLETLGHAHSHA